VIRAVIDVLIGALFAVGLVVSGMTQPGKVVHFLDVTGAWDPSLALVMAGALLVHGLVLWGTRGLARPTLDAQFRAPAPGRIDAPLVLGSALFGVGWGLAGYCPGPALVGAVAGPAALTFTASMLGGMALQQVLSRGARGPTSAAVPASTVPANAAATTAAEAPEPGATA
jgi:uncharacterized membrane protein YedE/YeeE